MIRLFAVRLGAVLAKEFVQMRRDRVTFAMMLGIPILLLILFGYAINTDPKRLDAGLLATGQDHYSRAIISALEVSNYYRFVARPKTDAEAEALIQSGAVSFLVIIPSDFGARVDRGDKPQILVEADATDPAAASNAIGALGELAGRALLREQGRELEASETEDQQLSIVVHKRYNPDGVSQYFIVPGLLGVVLQMTMVMMTSIALTREIERGTMENLLAMPANGFEIMLGKVLPYFIVGGVQVTVILAAAKVLFHVPFVGNLAMLLAGVLIFVLAMVLLGYTFSTLARTQMQAMQLTFFFFLPSILMSGFMFPFHGMPAWAQDLGSLLPMTHFLRVVRAVMLKGASWSEIGFEYAHARDLHPGLFDPGAAAVPADAGLTPAAVGAVFRDASSNPIRTDHAPAPLPPARPPARRKPRPRLADGRAVPHSLRARPRGNCQDQARGRPRHAGGALSAALGLLPARSLAPARGGHSAEADAARPGLVRGSVEPALQPASAPPRRRLHRPDVARRSSLRSDVRARPEFLAPRQGPRQRDLLPSGAGRPCADRRLRRDPGRRHAQARPPSRAGRRDGNRVTV